MIVTDSVPKRTDRFLPPTSGQVWHSSVIGGSSVTAMSISFWFKYVFDSSLPVERCRHDRLCFRNRRWHQRRAADEAVHADGGAEQEFKGVTHQNVIVPVNWSDEPP
jgi:hypothetical protein